MKKLLASLLLVMVMLPGCVATDVKQAIERNAARGDAMVQKIEDGTSTRKEEQNFIRALRATGHSYNYYFNDVPLPADLKHLAGDKDEE